MQRVAALLLLALDIGGSQRRSADASRCIAQPLFELLVQCGHVRLRLLQRAVEMRKLVRETPSHFPLVIQPELVSDVGSTNFNFVILMNLVMLAIAGRPNCYEKGSQGTLPGTVI